MTIQSRTGSRASSLLQSNNLSLTVENHQIQSVRSKRGRFWTVGMLDAPMEGNVYESGPMSEFLIILFGTAFVNNVVLTKFLGLCPFMGVSNKLDSAFGMGMATTFVLTLAAVASWLLEHYLLAPLDIGYLRILAFILVIAAVVQLTEMAVQKTSPVLYQSLGVFLPLITTNCAVLGVALLNVQQNNSFIQSLGYGFGAAAGFTITMMLFAGLRERIALASVPAAFEGAPIAFIVAGVLSLAFMGFTGLITTD
jgi:electron transport complex protein RnfA